MNKQYSLIAIAAVTSLLTACGGGSSDSNTQSPVKPPVDTQSVPLQTTAVPAVYATPSLASALDYLNRERVRCGFGALKQNAALDQAAKSHVDYMTANFGGEPHFETPGRVGYTGVTPLDRAIAKGYTTNWNEVFEVGVLPEIYNNLNMGATLTNMDGYALHALRTDLSAPYHGMGLLSAGVDIGMAFGGRNEVINNEQFIQMSFFAEIGRGETIDGQLPATPTVRTFPCEGTTEVMPAVFSEFLATGPFFPSRNMNTNPIGHPIYVVGEHGTTLTISNATITRVSNGQNIPITETRTKNTDAVHGSLFRESWFGFIIPDVPLVPYQAYRVRVEGSSDAKPFVKEFTFTPGQYGAYDMGIVRALGLATR